MIGHDTEFGARAARRLRDEVVVWMTTITESFAAAYSVPVRVRLTHLDGH